MMFNVTLVAPIEHGSTELQTVTDTVDGSDISAWLGHLGHNWRNSDQWSKSHVFIVIEPAKLDAEAKVRELQDKLDSIQVILSR